MREIRSAVILLFVGAFLLTAHAESSEDWRVWRGPNGNGVASGSANPPLSWSSSDRQAWKAIIPGRGHGSPIVCGDLVVVPTATDSGQYLLAYDRGDGSIRWKARAHDGGVPTKLHRKNTAASSTAASDGRLFFVLFHNRGQLHLSAFDRNGEPVWQKDTGPFACDYNFGYGSSPALYRDLLIVTSEFAEGGYIAAFRTGNGEEAWRVDRKVKTSYSSPIVAEVAGRDQLLLSGANRVVSLDPLSGKPVWEVEGSSLATCGTMVWSEDAVFASGGFPNKETLAIRADGSREVLWRTPDKSYEQSLLYHDGHIYAFNDTGIAVCWNAETGERKWRERLGGPVSASPILAGGRIHAMNERGEVFVFLPNPERFEEVDRFQVGDEGFATPVFVGNSVFLRTAEQGASRQEYLIHVRAPSGGS